MWRPPAKGLPALPATSHCFTAEVINVVPLLENREPSFQILRTAFFKRAKGVFLLRRMLHSLRSWSIDRASVEFLLSSIWYHFLCPASPCEAGKSASCHCHPSHPSLRGKQWVFNAGYASQAEQRRQQTHRVESPSGVNSITGVTASKGSCCGTSAPLSAQRQYPDRAAVMVRTKGPVSCGGSWWWSQLPWLYSLL